jgi:hypothetical protein
VIDEAQALSLELLEEIRLLANIETATEKLLPLVLTGQPELKDRLNEPGLRQLKQRITLRCEITPFSLGETGAYIASRIHTAGGDAAKLFTREAIKLIHEKSNGIPRVINVICDNALVTGFGLERHFIDHATVGGVVRDFDLGGDKPLDGDATERADLVPRSDTAVTLSSVVTVDEKTAPDEHVGHAGNARERFSMEGDRRRFTLFR